MKRLRGIVCCAALLMALAPLGAFADDDTAHDEAELANAQAQLVEAQQQVADMQVEAQQSAANERMIALTKSEAMRQMQLNNVANGNALEQIATSLATAARANADLSARNELMIAQARAAALVAYAENNLANAQMLAETRGRSDELSNAQAQSTFLHQLADYLTSAQAQINMASARQVGEMQADALEAPGLAEQQNADAMGANELLAADTELAAGQLNATSVLISAVAEENEVLAHAEASLANAEAMLAEDSQP